MSLRILGTYLPRILQPSSTQHLEKKKKKKILAEKMADTQSPGARVQDTAEDRKAATALASLDAAPDDTTNKDLDSEAVTKAIKTLGSNPAAPKPTRNIKVDDADVALLVDQLELPRGKAAELLRAHEGDAVGAMRAWVGA